MSANGAIFLGPCQCNVCFGSGGRIYEPPVIPGVNLDDWGYGGGESNDPTMECIWGFGSGYSRAHEPSVFGSVSDHKYPAFRVNAELAAYQNLILLHGASNRPVWVEEKYITQAIPLTVELSMLNNARYKLIVDIFVDDPTPNGILTMAVSVNSGIIPGPIVKAYSIHGGIGSPKQFHFESEEFLAFIPLPYFTIPVQVGMSALGAGAATHDEIGRAVYDRGPFFAGGRIHLQRII